MSMQSKFGDASSSTSRGGEGQRLKTARRAVSDHLVVSLAGGLRSTYQAEPETDMPAAFADLISRLHRAENRAR